MRSLVRALVYSASLPPTHPRDCPCSRSCVHLPRTRGGPTWTRAEPVPAVAGQYSGRVRVQVKLGAPAGRPLLCLVLLLLRYRYDACGSGCRWCCYCVTGGAHCHSSTASW
ncbi:uncharacterized protein B0H18DRAFT_523763 [Fomitopsis serialis]|uniref:uncharacterized protein n=1 Tax=Fomitopsis serialis TaxID=139415 RepID=UPI0020082C79|nr:uncharacterized protein B0H18DRAFT_523763 [Neoantrodia serialis]KAH9922251.1 hypothetical protein B0H18DRAFT_523763 [Neoantrodia serialis]